MHEDQKRTVFLLREVPVEDIKPDGGLLEDLDMDSLASTELAQRLESASSKPVDEYLFNVEDTTVARCAEITQAV